MGAATIKLRHYPADDIARSERLAKQVAFFKANPNVALVGSWVRFVDEGTREVVFHFRPPCDAEGIRAALFVNSCIIHPTWMVRTQSFQAASLYSNAYPAAEDYEFLRRMSARFDFANLPEFLLDYSISMSGVSMKRRRRQLFDRLRIQVQHFDPWRWNAWYGVLRTIALFAVPRKVVAAYRTENFWWFQPSKFYPRIRSGCRATSTSSSTAHSPIRPPLAEGLACASSPRTPPMNIWALGCACVD